MPRPMNERARNIALHALARPGAERSAYLDGACGEDAELRRAVQAELDLMRPPGLGSPENRGEHTVVGADPHGGVLEGPGATIGAYKILQLIGEGGFGFVYMAQQTHPVRRKLALKI